MFENDVIIEIKKITLKVIMRSSIKKRIFYFKGNIVIKDLVEMNFKVKMRPMIRKMVKYETQGFSKSFHQKGTLLLQKI